MEFHIYKSDSNKDFLENFSSNHENYTVFQSFEMYGFWKLQKNYEPFIFFIKSNEGECLAFCSLVVMSNGNLVIKKLTQRAIIFGGPLIKQTFNKNEISEYFIKEIQRFLKKKSIYIEARNFHEDSAAKEAFIANEWKYIPYQNYIIDLSSKEEVLSKIKSEKRRQIRKGIREGVVISYEKSEDNIKGVYEVLSSLYTKKVKKPLPSFEFFSNLMLLDCAGMTSLTYNNSIIGGGFFLKDSKVVYDWYRGGLDYEYKKQYPATIAAWALIEYGLDNSFERFDFMGAGVKGETYGVRQFKSQFGGNLVEYGRFLKINNEIVYKAAKTALRLLKK